MKKRGFTLIELLVVVAIIALLMGVLMPVLRKARMAARAVGCQSNLRHWGLIFAMYLEDNDGCFYSGLAHSPTGAYIGSSGEWWRETLKPLSKNPKMWLCPAATANRRPAPPNTFSLPLNQFEAWRASSDQGSDQGSYLPNGWTCNPPPQTNGVHGRGPKENYWRRVPSGNIASQVPVFSEGWGIDAWPRETDEPPEYEDRPPPFGANNHEMKRICVNRHGGTQNSLFMDWSARKVGLKELWDLKWHRNYNVNAPKPTWPKWIMHKCRE